ncbi:Predicted methyltransferase, contains TPR repeat [Rhizobiales bacterium GAS113]|nr:Predicted methyltransferase, contains TPR repeat [Rhizobiales bacterium GAS113]
MTALPAGFSSSGEVRIDRRYRWAQASLEAGDAGEAREILEQTVKEAPLWAPAWKLYADALQRCGDSEAARLAYEEAARLDPAGALGAGLDLARLGARALDEAMSPGYVAALFDDYADRFDAHLTQVLHYRGPQAILAALRQTCATAGRELRFANVLDLGCGTGLMGEVIRPFAGALAGVDISAGMIAKARAKLVYDRLVLGGLLETLGAEPRASLDLIVAADVLVYMADLAPVLAAAAAALVQHGLFAFTLQSCADEAASAGYVLGPDNRFAHSADHIRSAAMAASLFVLHLEPVVTRQDAGRDVAGWVAVLGRSS